MKMYKKGQAIQTLQAMVGPLVGVAIVLVVGFLIMTEVKTQATSIEGSTGDRYAFNATEEVMEAMDDIPGWLPIVVVAVIGAALLGLVAYFRAR